MDKKKVVDINLISEFYHPGKRDVQKISEIYSEAFSDSPSHLWTQPDERLFKITAPRCFHTKALVSIRVGQIIATSSALEGIL